MRSPLKVPSYTGRHPLMGAVVECSLLRDRCRFNYWTNRAASRSTAARSRSIVRLVISLSSRFGYLELRTQWQKAPAERDLHRLLDPEQTKFGKLLRPSIELVPFKIITDAPKPWRAQSSPPQKRYACWICLGLSSARIGGPTRSS